MNQEGKRPPVSWTWGLAVLVLSGWLVIALSARGQSADQGRSPAPEPPSKAKKAAPLAEEEPIPTKDLLSIVREGGPLMIPIGLCSLILVAFVFERTIGLSQSRQECGSSAFEKRLGSLDEFADERLLPIAPCGWPRRFSIRLRQRMQ